MYKFIISILFFCIGFSLDTDWQTYGNHEVSLNSIIIEFKDSHAPSLGIEPPLDFAQVASLNNLEKSNNFKNLEPLFNSYNSFTQLHRDHNLHKYYRLTFNAPESNLLSLVSDLKRWGILERGGKQLAYCFSIRFFSKKALIIARHSSARTPLKTSSLWLFERVAFKSIAPPR